MGSTDSAAKGHMGSGDSTAKGHTGSVDSTAKGHTGSGDSAANASRPSLPVSVGLRLEFVDLVWIDLLSKRRCCEQKLLPRWVPSVPGCPALAVLEQYPDV